MLPVAMNAQTETGSDRNSTKSWHMVRHCETLEAAENLLRDLENDGITASISMIDGLSVIAGNVTDSAR